VSDLDFLVRLLRWRKFIFINTGIVAVLAVGLSLLMPNWYAAHVSVFPPQEEPLSVVGFTRGLSSAVGTAQQAAAALTGRTSLPFFATPSDYLVGILRSRRLREQLIREHDLIALYKCKNMDQALRILAPLMKTQIGREGILHLEIVDKDPERAAAMAASALRLLDEIQREARRGRAVEVGRFVGARLDTTRIALAAAEDSLRIFEERHGLLAPEEQAAALVRTVATVEAERLAAQVERDALAAQFGATHPDVLKLDALLTAYGEAKAQLEGAGSQRAAGGPSAIIGLQRLPELSFAYLRRLREVEIQTALFEILTQMHEQYRIQEVQDTPTIQVLDPPAVPQEKAKPHRSIICIVATLLAFLLSTGVAAGLERVALTAEADPARYEQLARLLRGVGLGLVLARRGEGRR